MTAVSKALTDRQRVELTLAPMLLLDVVMNGPVDTAAPAAIEARTFLVLATTELVKDLPKQHRDKILRRSRRVFDEVTAPYRTEGAAVSKMGLIAFYWLQTLVSTGYFVLAEDTDLQRALDRVLPALEASAAIGPLNASAQKQADRMLRHLQRLGYFQEVMG